MKNLLWRVISLSLACAVIMYGVTISQKNKSLSASANELGTVDFSSTIDINSNDLQEVADMHSDVELLTGEAAEFHNQQVDAVLTNPELSVEEREAALENLGVYSVYQSDETELASSASDVTVYKPTVSYDSGTKQYIITSYGKWNNQNCVKDWEKNFVGFLKKGDIYNVGEKDAVAISLQKTSGNLTGVELVSGKGTGYCYSDSGFSTSSSTKITGEDLKGAAYKLQDKVKVADIKDFFKQKRFITYKFNLEYFTCTLRYNSSFSKFNGQATMHYVHTWNSTSINSITLGVTSAGTGTISVSFSKKSSEFVAYSYGKAIVNGKNG